MKKRIVFPKVFRKNLIPLIRFEIIYKLMFFFVLLPLAMQFIQLSLSLTNFRYLTKENVGAFFRHPITLTCMFLLLVLLAYFSMLDVGAIIYNIDRSYQNEKTNVLEMAKFGFLKSLRIFSVQDVLMSIFILLILPFFSMGVGFGYFRMVSFSDLIIDFLRKKWGVAIVFFVLIVFLFVLFIRLLYSFQYFFLEEKNFKEACIESLRLNKGSRCKDAVSLLFIQIASAVCFLVVTFILVLSVIGLIRLFVARYLRETVAYATILIILTVFYFVFVAMMTPVAITWISVMYYQKKEARGEKIRHCEKMVLHRLKNLTVTPVLIELGAAFFAVATGVCFFFLLKTGVISFQSEYAGTIEVAAHRGASNVYPENSMSAFRGAKELGADWIELDVQQTKDGEIIIMHDTNLYRTTGQKVNIWQLQYDDLVNMEIGSWFSTEFTGEPIPTLREVLEFAKENHIRLNIELKPTGYEKDFEKNVIDLINEYKMKKQCVVTSQVYEVLQKVKEYDSEIETVYVMSVAYGNILRLKDADSFSIKHTFVTSSLVSSVHNAGKKIYAWTVNSSQQIKEMINLNVDIIVTDDIPLAQKEIYSSRTSDRTAYYLKKMFGVELDKLLK